MVVFIHILERVYIILCNRYLLGGGIELVLWEGRFGEPPNFFCQHIMVIICAVGEKDINVESKDIYMLNTRVSYCGIYCDLLEWRFLRGRRRFSFFALVLPSFPASILMKFLTLSLILNQS